MDLSTPTGKRTVGQKQLQKNSTFMFQPKLKEPVQDFEAFINNVFFVKINHCVFLYVKRAHVLLLPITNGYFRKKFNFFFTLAQLGSYF